MEAMQTNQTTADMKPDMSGEIVKSGRLFFTKLGLALLAGTLIIYGTQNLVASLVKEFAPMHWWLDVNIVMIISMVPMYLIGMPLLMLLLKILVPAQKLEGRKMSFGSLLLAIIMSYSLMYLSNWIGMGITFVIEQIKGGSVTNELEMVVTTLHPALSILFMVICAPIMEELIFRKFLVDRAVRYGEGVAILLSGLVFGLFHANLAQFVYTFVLGMFLAFIYVKTGRLRYTIIIHMVVNFLGSIVAPAILKLVSEGATGVLFTRDSKERLLSSLKMFTGYSLLIGYVLLILGIVIAGVVLFIVFRKKFKLASRGIQIPKGKAFAVVFLNLGMILFVAYFVVKIVQQLIA